MAFSKFRDGSEPKPQRPQNIAHARVHGETADYVKGSLKMAKVGIAKERIGEELIERGKKIGGRPGRTVSKRGQEMSREGKAEYNYWLKRGRAGNQLIRARHDFDND